MPHDPFSKQQEIAQASQLGLLEEEYVLHPRKIFAYFGLIFVGYLVLPLVLVLVSFHEIADVLPLLLFFFLFGFVVVGGAMLAFYFAYRRLHVYVYSHGFLYLNGRTSRVVYWQQIKGWSSNRGFFYVKLYHDGWISIPRFVGRYYELRARILQSIVPQR